MLDIDSKRRSLRGRDFSAWCAVASKCRFETQLHKVEAKCLEDSIESRAFAKTGSHRNNICPDGIRAKIRAQASNSCVCAHLSGSANPIGCANLSVCAKRRETQAAVFIPTAVLDLSGHANSSGCAKALNSCGCAHPSGSAHPSGCANPSGCAKGFKILRRCLSQQQY